ncbi:hypothetical protein CUZ56_01763 [Saezia sanguinis]|uniref:Uncharacterized protein n=1 Tax=Saezia sanguinis TaxID=1965230 RepID=A0A433SCL1_9BURK|nr:hypothetical protein [Saezia sanguinis]RUS66483.1 hypothetical protein CUZ56_01763 [Saezia sanguinis]
MLWQRNAPGPCFLPNERGGERRPVFDLVGELGGVIFPYKMIDAEYPDAITIGFDAQGVQYMRTFPQGGISTQGQYVEILNKLLGEPILMHIKEGGNSDRGANAPAGIPEMMWVGSADDSVVAIWETDYAWARYIGKRFYTSAAQASIGECAQAAGAECNRQLAQPRQPESCGDGR